MKLKLDNSHIFDFPCRCDCRHTNRMLSLWRIRYEVITILSGRIETQYALEVTAVDHALTAFAYAMASIAQLKASPCS